MVVGIWYRTMFIQLETHVIRYHNCPTSTHLGLDNGTHYLIDQYDRLR